MLTIEQIKTLINGLKQIIPPFIKPNWGVNDPKSPDFIEGRTHHVNDDGTVSPLDEKFLPEWPAKYEEAVQRQMGTLEEGLSVDVFCHHTGANRIEGVIQGALVGGIAGPIYVWEPYYTIINPNAAIRYYHSPNTGIFVSGIQHTLIIEFVTNTTIRGEKYKVRLLSNAVFNSLEEVSSPAGTGSPTIRYTAYTQTLQYVDPITYTTRSVSVANFQVYYYPFGLTGLNAKSSLPVIVIPDTQIQLEGSNSPSGLDLMSVRSTDEQQPFAWIRGDTIRNYGVDRLEAPLPLQYSISISPFSFTDTPLKTAVKLNGTLGERKNWDVLNFVGKLNVEHTIFIHDGTYRYPFKVDKVFYKEDVTGEPVHEGETILWSVLLRMKGPFMGSTGLARPDCQLKLWWEESSQKAYCMLYYVGAIYQPELPLVEHKQGGQVLRTSNTRMKSLKWSPELGIEKAEVGQTVVVSAVDENGVPTAWEAVDLPAPPRMPSVPQFDVTTTELARYIWLDALNGSPLESYGYTEMRVSVANVPQEAETLSEFQVWYNAESAGWTANPYIAAPTGFISGKAQEYWGGYINIRNGNIWGMLSAMRNPRYRTTITSNASPAGTFEDEVIRTITLKSVMTDIPVGTSIKIWLA